MRVVFTVVGPQIIHTALKSIKVFMSSCKVPDVLYPF